MGANNCFNYDNTPVQEEVWKSYYTRIFTTYYSNDNINSKNNWPSEPCVELAVAADGSVSWLGPNFNLFLTFLKKLTFLTEGLAIFSSTSSMTKKTNKQKKRSFRVIQKLSLETDNCMITATIIIRNCSQIAGHFLLKRGWNVSLILCHCNFADYETNSIWSLSDK